MDSKNLRWTYKFRYEIIVKSRFFDDVLEHSPWLFNSYSGAMQAGKSAFEEAVCELSKACRSGFDWRVMRETVRIDATTGILADLTKAVPKHTSSK